MRYLVRVFYEGKNYYGYQRQPNITTIEGNIITMLEKSKHIQNAKLSNFRSASRTDKSVNAIGNVFAFDSGKKIILDQINAAGPSDKSIICWAYSEVEDAFSPKFSKWKKYWYVLPSNHVEKTFNLSLEELKNLCSVFEGKHDFRLFCRKDHRVTNREISKIDVFEKNDNIVCEFIAQSFLWEQIRRIVSYVLNFNQLSEELQDTIHLLNPDNQIEEINLAPADPRNLILVEHFYENIKWIESEKATKSILKKLKIEFLDFQRDLSINSILYNFFRVSDTT
ncbi:MAG: tRNA pseudouridine(38-40) synthase TruA [Candidatus Heimdallarchaeota archaeon]|nr:tRNA pseudouridine(38-40) synthase TruA [Candidatus Heimdallarchaeota archaeon]MCK4768723.1 tRNA pseudouridine(38-40) synthase TruA [Candidatus Heimdallarchaeota archaeon]